MGDGEINEGSVWEAALMASKYKLNNLTAIIDYNKIQSAGYVKDILPLEPLKEKWEAFGFMVRQVNGHDVNALKSLVEELPFSTSQPSVVICHTTKGKGIDFAENNPEWHHKSRLSSVEIDSMLSSLSE